MSFDALFNDKTAKLSDGKRKEIQKRKLVFELDTDVCAPSIFEPEHHLFLRISELTTKEEMAAARNAKGPDMMYMMAFAAMKEVALTVGEGERKFEVLSRAKKEWLWEVLGTIGRSTVVHMFRRLLGEQSSEEVDDAEDPTQSAGTVVGFE